MNVKSLLISKYLQNLKITGTPVIVEITGIPVIHTLYTSHQMKRKLTLILFTLTFSSCFFSGYESELIKSPTGNFKIKATVKRKNNKLAELNTGAGDANKWAIGWTENGDTIVLQSSDIGNKAWMLNMNKPNQIKITDELNKHADFLNSKKYK